MTTLDKTGIEAARNEFVHSMTKEQIERWAYKWADDLLSTADALSSLPAQAVGDGDFTERLREAAYRDTAKSVTVSAADLRAHLEATQRYVLNRLAPSQPAAVGERADALWEQLLPLMQVEECPPGDPYKDKVAALALIEAALRSTP